MQNFRPIASPEDGPKSQIKDVWFENLEVELPIITELLETYPYISVVRFLNLDNLMRRTLSSLE